MDELLYDITTLAWIILSRDISVKSSQEFLSNIWEYEKEYLYMEYRSNKKEFILDVMEQINYLQNKDVFDTEFPAINRDLQCIGSDRQFVKKGRVC